MIQVCLWLLMIQKSKVYAFLELMSNDITDNG